MGLLDPARVDRDTGNGVHEKRYKNFQAAIPFRVNSAGHFNPSIAVALAMNLNFLPTDATAYTWQLACCVITLLFAMFSWLAGPR